MDLSNYNWWKVLDTFASHYKFRLQQAPPPPQKKSLRQS